MNNITKNVSKPIINSALVRAGREKSINGPCTRQFSLGFLSDFPKCRSRQPNFTGGTLRQLTTNSTPSVTKKTGTSSVEKQSSSQIDDNKPSLKNMGDGLSDELVNQDDSQVDWTRSFHGLSVKPFSKESADILMAPLPYDDVEVKPDGVVYLPEIKYRRILNRAFGPGAWGLAPRGETIVTEKSITREYALVVHGRLVSIARGEQDYFSPEGIPTATEGCKSNALMRCCKDLGIASELWDPRFIRKFLSEKAKQVWAEHTVTKRKKQIWMRKDDELRYPYKQS
ncbi:mitochondrial genome maintenance protein [Blumeria hordei DH14]|uniref:Mitochondrial genome maintenance protein MGM101 n=1 Tax=Blumeria graminis f. sp. hordei (strain DH14) TaxID=546991 RepID=N1JFK9_BLUG1|nr:mitochondrial genome maintenance protein [Blumeria hordei DH14]